MNFQLPFSKDTRIAVTGATGFVGSYLVRTLIGAGCTRVKALKRKNSPLQLLGDCHDKVEWIEGDLLDTEKVRELTGGVELIFHCAAFVTFNPAGKKDLYRINVGGTAEIVDAALSCGVEKLVHCSSVSALGKDLKEKAVNEETEWREFPGISDYALSKYYSELEVMRGSAEGLNVSILTPSVILGAGFWNRGSAAMVKQIDREIPFYPSGSGGFVDVRDVAKMLILCAADCFSGERYISNAGNYSYREILSSMADYLEKPEPSRKISKWMIQVLPSVLKLLRTAGFKVPPLSKPMLIAASQKISYDNRKFTEATGFQYRPVEEAIVETCSAFINSRAARQNFGLLPID